MSDCYASNDEDGLAVCAAHRWSMAGVAPGGLCIEGRLIRSVHRVSPVSMLMPPNDVYAIIAAVEDWHERETLSGQVPEQCDECGGAA